ncbi:MAG: hypothetical protein NWS97_10610 [Limnohabitans sp.]|jgi:hypothetical protein|nr:hypothetical protein [Limnohabitans sp.]MDP4923882.1 hypothetical protein [Limnohabitans sp.]
MNPQIQEFLDRIQQLEAAIEQEAKSRRQQWQADFEERKVRFEKEVLAQQKRFKAGLLGYVLTADWRHVLCVPFIYPVLVPMLLLDAFITLYQWVCFPLCGIPRVKRSGYFVYDRTHLAYLNWLEKINCAYCSYGNGLMAYGREVVALTEKYWCPIKHARRRMQAHGHYHGFADYGDAENYRAELVRLRTELKAMAAAATAKADASDPPDSKH